MRRVLIVDDERDLREAFATILCHSGFEADLAASGTEAIGRLRQGGYDAVLADLRLPDFSGVELLKLARSEGIATPFAIVSGFASVGSAVEALKAGAVTYLEKPVDPQQLTRVVTECMDARQVNGVALPAFDRWAELVVRALGTARDPRTVEEWARACGHSRATVENRCRTVRLATKRSLDFTRTLRAVVVSFASGLDPESLLDADVRTVTRLLRDGGVPFTTRMPRAIIGPAEFLERQTFIRNVPALKTIAALLSRGDRSAATSPERLERSS